jgi:hypothetical protein
MWSKLKAGATSSLAAIMKFIESKKFLWVLEIGTTVMVALFLIISWTVKISIDTQYVPTIINGLTTCVAVLIGFGATCLTMMRTYYPQKWEMTIIGITFLGFSTIILFIGYSELIFHSNFETSLRLLLTSFIFVASAVFGILFSLLKEHW